METTRMTTSRLIRFGLLVFLGLDLLVPPLLASVAFSDIVPEAAAFVIYAFPAGLIIARRDGHMTGWLLVLIGLLLVFIACVTYTFDPSELLPQWVSSWAWTALFALFGSLTLTFPSGRLPQGTGLWARAGRMAAFALPMLVIASALTERLGGPEMLEETPNPFGFLPDWMGTATLLGVVVILLSGVVSLVLQRRRSSGVTRAQLTWVVFGLVLLVTAIVLTFLFITVSVAMGADDPGDEAWILAYGVIISFPLTFAVAILRYRLYEIDRIISRTIAYVAVVALLAAVFMGVVTAVGSLVQTESDIVIAASTLAVAALFNPLRQRVQSVVDRRFNRPRYDAQRVTESFAASLQGRIDGRDVVDGWVGVVSETMQPAGVGVWVRERSSQPFVGRAFG